MFADLQTRQFQLYRKVAGFVADPDRDHHPPACAVHGNLHLWQRDLHSRHGQRDIFGHAAIVDGIAAKLEFQLSATGRGLYRAGVVAVIGQHLEVVVAIAIATLHHQTGGQPRRKVACFDVVAKIGQGEIGRRGDIADGPGHVHFDLFRGVVHRQCVIGRRNRGRG